MRIQVEHDEKGAIKAIAIPYERPGQAAHLSLKARPGHRVAHVEAPELTSESDVETIREIKLRFRVEQKEGLHRLVRKDK